MPLEVVVLAPSGADVEAQRELGESMSPPLVVREASDRGSVSFTELDDTLVLTLLRAKRVEVRGEVERVVGQDLRVLSDTAVWTEGYIPFDQARRGLTVAYALAHLTDGTAVVKGLWE